MHIPDGLLSGPLNLGLGVASTAAVGLALWRGRGEQAEEQVPLIGMTAAFIFAAQMINFPVAAGTSGHFMGAALAAILLGPLRAVLIMAVVLIIQCFVFQDGGLTALGANIFNMGIVGGFLSYGVYRALAAILPKTRKARLAAAGLAAWVSVVGASACCAVEIGLSGRAPMTTALIAMSGVHALIGIGEGLITATVLGTVAASRPDLIPDEASKADEEPAELVGAGAKSP